MKQTTILLALLFSFSFTSCSENNEKQSSNETSQVIHLDTESFKEKVFDYTNNENWNYKGDKVAIIDFYATWCGPCKKLAPIYSKLSNEFKDQVYFYKVDVDKAKELAALFQIRSIPTLLYIPLDGEPRLVPGGISEENLRSNVKELLK